MFGIARLSLVSGEFSLQLKAFIVEVGQIQAVLSGHGDRGESV